MEQRGDNHWRYNVSVTFMMKYYYSQLKNNILVKLRNIYVNTRVIHVSCTWEWTYLKNYLKYYKSTKFSCVILTVVWSHVSMHVLWKTCLQFVWIISIFLSNELKQILHFSSSFGRLSYLQMKKTSI